MFYGIMWSDARGICPVPLPGRGGLGRGLAAGGALTWARARARAGHGRGLRGAGTQAARSRGAAAGPQEALSPPGAPALRAPDKGGAFLKRRRPLQAAAEMAALAGAGWGRGTQGVAARAHMSVQSSKWPATDKGFVQRPEDGRGASAWPTPFLASLNSGAPVPSNPLLE